MHRFSRAVPQGVLSQGYVIACVQAADTPDQRSWLAISPDARHKPWGNRALPAAQRGTRPTVHLQAHESNLRLDSYDMACTSAHVWGTS